MTQEQSLQLQWITVEMQLIPVLWLILAVETRWLHRTIPTYVDSLAWAVRRLLGSTMVSLLVGGVAFFDVRVLAFAAGFGYLSVYALAILALGGILNAVVPFRKRSE